MNDLHSESSNGARKRTYKIVLLGDEKVGKTSIINRFTANKFNIEENVQIYSVFSPLWESIFSERT